MAKFLKNQWYVAAWSNEIGDKPLGRRLLGEPVVLFRQADNSIAALIDRCPHRLVPLSMGSCVNGNLQCTYHGMQFNGSGQCVHIPAQNVIPPKAHIRSFPIVERYGFAWIWMGDPALADPTRIPKIEKYGEPGWEQMTDGYQHHPSNYLNLIENLMDPSHTTFLHPNTIGNPASSETPVTTERGEGYVVAYRWVTNSEPSPHDRRRLNVDENMKVDRGQYFYFYLPQMSRVETMVMPAGAERTDENMSANGLRTYSYKFLTPETESTTHFFWTHVRNYLLDDPNATDMLRDALIQTYNEDIAVEIAMQKSQQETGVRQMMALELDRGPMMAVRMLERMIEAENARPAA